MPAAKKHRGCMTTRKTNFRLSDCSMSQYTIRDPEELQVCPYDPVHMIRAKRMPYHLMKCRRNFLDCNYATCPFNARHEVPKPELRYHISNCTDRAVVEKDLINNKRVPEEGSYFHGCTDVPPVDDSWIPEATENWDAEVTRHPVNIIDKSVFRIPQRHSVNYARMTLQEKKTLMENLNKRGIPVEMKADPGSLRLPHNQPKVLGAATNPDVSTSKTDSMVMREMHSKIEIQATLLQSMARGRGIRTNTESEPKVGYCS